MTVAGVTHATRPMSAEHRAAPAKAEQMDDAKALNRLSDLFADPRPDLSAWTPAQLNAFAGGYSEYAARWERARLDATGEYARAAVDAAHPAARH